MKFANFITSAIFSNEIGTINGDPNFLSTAITIPSFAVIPTTDYPS